jgi:hypothetical protein
MQLVVAGVVALGGSAICASGAGAQAAAASPFHTGQWGIEGYATGGTGGVMRFVTPRTALVLTLSTANTSTKHVDQSASLVSIKMSQVDGTLGFRRHSMLASKVVGVVGLGALGGTSAERDVTTGPIGPYRYRSWYFGGYADFGGQYMVADHFAVGIAYRASARHLKNDISNQAGTQVFTGVLPIRATLYF